MITKAAMLYARLIYNQNWNIGFTEDTVQSFLEHQALGKMKWMKHSYRDRFFADPFVLKTTDNAIIILAEELIFTKGKGCIVKLIIDKETKRLLERMEVLELDTHLSYPIIIRNDDLIHIYPENGASGKLNMYSYNDETSTVTFIKTLVEEPLADSTILYYGGKYWLIATKYPQTQENAYLYDSNSFDGEYSMTRNAPIATNSGYSRPAGNFINYKNTLYRPAQNCVEWYGAGIAIQKIEAILDTTYSEKTLFTIFPNSFKYNLGLHTINFYDGGCVIDGCGYLYPAFGRVLKLLSIIKNKLVK